MGETTNISWTDATFNPWIGCAKVHTGCKNCYAETLMDTRYGRVNWGPNGTRLATAPANWAKPRKWNRDAEVAGKRRRVFCASLCDIFEEIGSDFVFDHKGERIYRHVDGPLGKPSNDPVDHYRVGLDHLRRDLFDLIDETPWLDWQLLTKRPENIQRMWPLTPGIPKSLVNFDESGKAVGYKQYERITQLMFRPNVWLGTSVSDQETADKMLPELNKCGDLCPVLFASYEPALGPIDLAKHATSINWLIVGGESGRDARPCRQTWIADAVRQCAIYGIACFIKQFGSNAEEGYGVNRKLRLDDSKGGDPNEWPEELRVRQFPWSASI